ncbi:MAG TPA: hypothetical protein VGA76_12985 [Candidatus Dormibacteraeota bacterium]
MSDPPPPPQVSADGKFYWDGHRWVPMQQQVAAQPAVAQRPVPSSHRGRNIGCAAVIVGIVGIFIIASVGGRHSNNSTLKWDVSGRAIRTSHVGGSDSVQITVKNNGPKASNFIIYLNSGDDWFKHHVITGNDGGCSINKDLERLECGPLESGATKTVNIDGSPKDPGNFNFEAAAADQEGSDLLYPQQDGVLTWSEAVTA